MDYMPSVGLIWAVRVFLILWDCECVGCRSRYGFSTTLAMGGIPFEIQYMEVISSLFQNPVKTIYLLPQTCRINVLPMFLLLFVLFLFPDFIVAWQICNIGGRGPLGGYTLSIYVQVHTRAFLHLALVYPEVLNKCDHKLVLIIKNAQ